MPTYAALLRGVNVSGKNNIPMAELRRCVEGLGYPNVRTWLQSGNTVFSAVQADPLFHAAALKDAIRAAFGCEVEVLVFTAAELQQIEAETWPAFGGQVDRKFCHATFFQQPLVPANFATWDLPAVPGEQAALALSGRAVLLHCPHGYGRTRLNNAWFERKAGQPATTRNWTTLSALAGLGGEG